jgi:acyl-CoA thioester hydrolase
LLVSATVRVAFVSEGRAKRIPDSLRQATLADAREAEALGDIRR